MVRYVKNSHLEVDDADSTMPAPGMSGNQAILRKHCYYLRSMSVCSRKHERTNCLKKDKETNRFLIDIKKGV